MSDYIWASICTATFLLGWNLSYFIYGRKASDR